MKYYKESRVVNEGKSNEYVFQYPYNIDNLPVNKPVYGLAYEVNDDTEYKRLSCEPVLGEIVSTEDIECKLWSKYVFVPYKNGTTERRKSGYVDFQSRMYADTYSEAVEMYNELVKKRIDNLYKLIGSAEDDIISVL